MTLAQGETNTVRDPVGSGNKEGLPVPGNPVAAMANDEGLGGAEIPAVPRFV